MGKGEREKKREARKVGFGGILSCRRFGRDNGAFAAAFGGWVAWWVLGCRGARGVWGAGDYALVLRAPPRRRRAGGCGHLEAHRKEIRVRGMSKCYSSPRLRLDKSDFSYMFAFGFLPS